MAIEFLRIGLIDFTFWSIITSISHEGLVVSEISDSTLRVAGFQVLTESGELDWHHTISSSGAGIRIQLPPSCVVMRLSCDGISWDEQIVCFNDQNNPVPVDICREIAATSHDIWEYENQTNRPLVPVARYRMSFTDHSDRNSPSNVSPSLNIIHDLKGS